MSAHGSLPIAYRRAGPSDAATCVRLLGQMVREIASAPDAQAIEQALPADMARALASPESASFLAEAKGVAIGLSRADILAHDPTFRLRPDRRCGYIDQMYVESAYRERGVGQALLQLCEQFFAEHRIYDVLLHAAPKAVRLYARLGYLPNRQMYKALQKP